MTLSHLPKDTQYAHNWGKPTFAHILSVTLFIGRERELEKLESLKNFSRPKIAVIKGRRRVGKSRLVEEYAKDKIFLSFSGVPLGQSPIPAKAGTTLRVASPQEQRDIFSEQLSERFQKPAPQFSDWMTAFRYLSNQLTQAPTVILFDEISWMGSKDHMFIPLMKNWWDLVLKDYPNLTLVFCGSVSTWIEENIIKSTAFYGRITLNMTLPPLSLLESAQLLRARGYKGSIYDIYHILCVTGCIPWYLEQIDPSQMAMHNIQRLCFQQDGALFQEFQIIFHDLFNGRGSTYKAILNLLADGMKTQEGIRAGLNYNRSGTLSQMLEHLEICGFICKHPHWSFKTGKSGKQSLYRIEDPYIRFYLKYIEPNAVDIKIDSVHGLSLEAIGGFDTMIGLQMEQLLLQNRHLLNKALGLSAGDYVHSGPYSQKATKEHRGCQIDYLVQTKMRNLLMCEFKFTYESIGIEIFDDMKKKMKALVVPENFSVVPVLFHFGSITEKVALDGFFFRTISLYRFLNEVRIDD